MAATAVRIFLNSGFHNFNGFIRMFAVFTVTGACFVTFFGFTFTAVTGTPVNSLLTSTGVAGSVTVVVLTVTGESPSGKNKQH